MNLEHPPQRVLLHLCALAHRPGHLRFHLSGIARELPHLKDTSAIPTLVITTLWFIAVALLLMIP
jgi:hypothetical protein